MTLNARVHSQSITLTADVSIAEATSVDIYTLEEAPKSHRGGVWMFKYAGVADDLPADAATQHGHYLNLRRID